MTVGGLVTLVARLVARRSPERAAVVRVVRDAHPYASSHVLERWTVGGDDGSELLVVAKRIDDHGTLEAAIRTRPSGVYSTTRERFAYERLFAQGGLAVAPLLGVVDHDGAVWLLVDEIDGPPLTEVGDLRRWCETARVAARLHDVTAPLIDEARRVGSFGAHDIATYHQWYERARGTVPDPLLDAARRTVPPLLLDGPQRIVHGELYASNVMVGTSGPMLIDFETIHIGPPATDLAALVTGWPAEARTQMIDAYCATSSIWGPTDAVELSRLVAAAAAQFAVQWSGWAADWEPPAAHRRDWAAELAAAMVLVEA